MLAISTTRFRITTGAKRMIEWEAQGFEDIVRTAPALPVTSTEAITVGTALTLDPGLLPSAAPLTTQRHAVDLLSMQGTPPAPPAEGWEQTVGMFDNDPIINEILDAGQRIRESRRPH